MANFHQFVFSIYWKLGVAILCSSNTLSLCILGQQKLRTPRTRDP